MTVETTTPAVETIASTVTQPIAKKAANLKPVIKARPAPKMPKPVVKKVDKKPITKKAVAKLVAKKAVAKPVAKKAAKIVKTPRVQHTYILSPKADLANFGTGQRLVIAKLIKKGATRADLSAKLPDVKPESIGWHLSMMVKDGEAKKVATK